MLDFEIADRKSATSERMRGERVEAPESKPTRHEQIAGRIEGTSVAEILWALCRRQKTGAFRVARNGLKKTLFLDRGKVVFAASEDADDRIGPLLLRRSLVSLAQLDEAVRGQGRGRRLGSLLVEAGHLAPEELVAAIHEQIRSTAHGLLELDHGEYRFTEGPLPEVSGRTPFRAPGLRRRSSWIARSEDTPAVSRLTFYARARHGVWCRPWARDGA